MKLTPSQLLISIGKTDILQTNQIHYLNFDKDKKKSFANLINDLKKKLLNAANKSIDIELSSNTTQNQSNKNNFKRINS